MLNRYQVKIVTEMGVLFVKVVVERQLAPFLQLPQKKEVVDISKKALLIIVRVFWKLGQLVISSLLYASKHSCNLRLVLNLHIFLLY